MQSVKEKASARVDSWNLCEIEMVVKFQVWRGADMTSN